MILIPELKTVVILVPRTGSGSLYRAILDKYPRAMMPYRHMEADGVPHGYDRWPKIGVLRHPLERLWSLYNFIARMGSNRSLNTRFAVDKHRDQYVERLRRSVTAPFAHWVVNNEVVFTDPYNGSGGLEYWPEYTVLHARPETKKSQFIYLRPDLGTEIFSFNRLHDIEGRLDIKLDQHNATDSQARLRALGQLPGTLRDHMQSYFAWDYQMYEELHGKAA